MLSSIFEPTALRARGLIVPGVRLRPGAGASSSGLTAALRPPPLRPGGRSTQVRTD